MGGPQLYQESSRRDQGGRAPTVTYNNNPELDQWSANEPLCKMRSFYIHWDSRGGFQYDTLLKTENAVSVAIRLAKRQGNCNDMLVVTVEGSFDIFKVHS